MNCRANASYIWRHASADGLLGTSAPAAVHEQGTHLAQGVSVTLHQLRRNRRSVAPCVDHDAVVNPKLHRNQAILPGPWYMAAVRILQEEFFLNLMIEAVDSGTVW